MNLKHNSGIKISALLLSVILWAYIWGERKANNEIEEETIQRQFDSIPIAALRAPSSLYEITVSHNEASAVLEGDKGILEKIDKRELIVYIDLRELTGGTYQLPPSWKIPNGIKIAVSSPEFVSVTIKDKRITEVIK